MKLLLLLLLPLLSLCAAQDLKWLPIGPSINAAPLQPQAPAGKQWAVLVAGSNTWSNYRHQADTCHAYQILRRNGIPQEQIITMMYDDIASNEDNPTPGRVINHLNGSDVYAGVKIDYRHREVTPENFLKILKGEGDGRVLRSGPNDNVFVNFVDHGAPGLIGFPTSVLKAKPLVEALQYMHSKKMYKRLVFYLEACESGSMFQKLLPDNIEIYATTAANAHESSYACYYDRQRRTYLGDVYSVNWMEDSDRQDVNTETLDRQFQIVKEETNTSHVMQFGDSTLGSLPVGDFQGNRKSAATPQAAASKSDAVSQRLARETILRRLIADSATEGERLRHQLQLRHLQLRNSIIAHVFDSILRLSLPHNAGGTARFLSVVRYSLNDFDCHHAVVDEIHSRCFNLGQNEEALAHVYKIVNLCESRVAVARIVSAVRMTCPTPRF